MDITNYTTGHRKGQHLLSEERHEIEVRLKDGWSIYRIAKHLGRPYNTIKNEIKRGTVSLYNGKVQRYKADEGKKVYLDKKSYPPQEMVKDCELFFMSDFCAALVGADASVIIYQARDIANRERMYFSLDPEKIRKVSRAKQKDDLSMLTEAHKYIVSCEFSTAAERKASRKWLKEHSGRTYKAKVE